MIAVDAMGGDYAPHAIVHGALQAAMEGAPVLLCGDQEAIERILSFADAQWKKLPLSIEHCTQTIDMAEEPSWAVVRKKDSSLMRAMRAVVEKRAQAVVSAGNSGAVLASSLLTIGRMPGVLRPAVACFVPTISGAVLCLDMGANADCKPAFLEQFAHLGALYHTIVTGTTRPSVGLLSNGHEPYKGSMLVKQVYDLLLRSELNFVGNVEARDIFDHRAEVIVCDGFTGNILLKGVQGAMHVFGMMIKQEAQASWWARVTMALSARVLRRVKERTNYERAGGALLLGVKEPVVLAHGCSKPAAIKNAILYAARVVQEQQVPRLQALFTPYTNRPASQLVDPGAC